MKTNWPALKHGCLILASVALATSPMLAQTQEPAGGRKSAAVISSVAITQSPERAAVRVEGEGRLDVRTARMHSPDRLVLDFAGARLAVDKTVIPGLAEPVRPDASSQEAAQQPIQQADTAANTLAATNANARVRAAATQAPAPGQTSAKYTGEPISVNLKDVDLRDFFRLIHEISGLNVVLDPAVKGSLTIVLDEVPWDQALDIVLQNNSLDKQLNGNVLRIATRATLKTEAETQRDLEKAQAEAVTPVTVTRVLSYAKAATMAPTLKKFLSSRGDILYDDRSNQVIIRDIPSVIPIIDNLIRQLDRKSQQVEIEARVVSASRSFARDIGTQLAFATSGGNNVIGGNSAVGASPIFRTIIPGVSTSPALTFGAPPVPTGTSSTAANVQMPLVTNLAAAT